MSKTDSVLESNIAEARGDWSGLKGSYFHLLYASKLALVDGLRVSFFDGNDLAALAETGNQILWVQLKSTDEDGAWGIYSILRDGTLFPTLLRNALQSKMGGRDWKIQLATPAEIKKDEIEKFIADPLDVPPPRARKDSKPPLPPLSDVFEGFVLSCHLEWSDSKGRNPFTLDDVRSVARDVLQQIADSPRILQQELENKIDLAIAYQGFDAEQGKAVRHAIIGAVSREAAPKELKGVTVDLEWVAKATGYERLAVPTLIPSPIEACANQVSSNLQHEWKQELCVRRPDLSEALLRFKASERSLFIITGESGTGKTWGMAHEAAVGSDDQLRVFLPADAVIEKGIRKALADEFRQYAHAQTTDEEIVRHLVNCASTLQRGPMIVFIDDLGVYETPKQDAGRLIQVAQDAMAIGVKAVLSMRYGVWHRLSRVSMLRDVAYLRSQQEGQVPKPSYEMPALSEDELAEYVRRRRQPDDPTESLIRWLQQPSQGALRNGYLLRLFLDQHPIEPNQPVEIDALLDMEFQRKVLDLASRADIDEGLAMDAMQALVAAVWNTKPNGLSRADAVKSIAATGLSEADRVFTSLQVADILAPSGSLRTAVGTEVVFTNPQFAERAMVRHMVTQGIDPVEVIKSLRPGVDDGIVTILGRSGVDELGVDALAWAEAVVEADPNWIPGVCRGLSQRSGAGWRIPAFLSSTANSYEDGRLAASFALGDMTYHSEKARSWLQFQVSDDRGSEGFMARLALAQSVKSNTHWTVAILEEQLRKYLLWQPTKNDEREERASHIRESLSPLKHLDDARAAKLAVRVLRNLRRNDPLPVLAGDDIRWSYEYDVNSIRGAMAAFGGGRMYEGLVAELRGGSVKRRRRSAYAARMIAFERPDDMNVRSAFLEAFSKERGKWPLYLWALYTYAKRSPVGIAEAIRQSEVLNDFRAGMAFVICAILGSHTPQEARDLLPRSLAAFTPIERSLMAEPLAFAWTLVGMADPQDETAREVLDTLANYDQMPIDKLFACFMERGAAVAQLGSILLDIPETLQTILDSDVFYHYWSFERNDGLVYIDLQEVYAKFGAKIAAHEGNEELIARLANSITHAAQFVTNPLRRSLVQSRFRIEVLGSDELAGLAPHLPNPHDLLNRLPQSWHSIRVCRALLGTPQEALGVKEGLELCRMSNGISSDAVRDRTEFLLELSQRALLPEEWHGSVKKRVFDERGAAKYLHKAVRNDPSSILDQLHGTFTRENAIRLAFDWSQDAEDWRSALLGRVFIYSLRHPSLTELECLTLLAQIREVVQSLPASTLRDSYLETLNGIEQIGTPNAYVPAAVADGDSYLDRALRLAAKIVILAHQKGSNLTTRDLRKLLEGGDGFVYDKSAKLNNHSVSRQMGQVVGTFCFAPLPHIALTLASTKSGMGDFAMQFAGEWLENEEKLNEAIGDVFSPLFNPRYPKKKRAMLARALRQVNKIINTTGLTAKLDDIRRHLLLLSKQFDRAGGGLLHKTQLPTFGETGSGDGDYNRACVAARAGMTRRCRFLLEKVKDKRPELLTQAWDDPDLRSIRRLHWFRKLVGRG